MGECVFERYYGAGDSTFMPKSNGRFGGSVVNICFPCDSYVGPISFRFPLRGVHGVDFVCGVYSKSETTATFPAVNNSHLHPVRSLFLMS
jgi:hypothetical protein